MIRIQVGNNTITVETAGDVLDVIRKYIHPFHPVLINTIEDQDGTLIVVSGVEAKPTVSTGRKK